jgi:hypothetical protein
MVSQKLVDAYFPGFALGTVFSSRLFNIVKEEHVGITQDRACSTCGAVYVSEMNRGPDNEAYPNGRCIGRCSSVVTQLVVGQVEISKSGRVRVTRFARELNLDF